MVIGIMDMVMVTVMADMEFPAKAWVIETPQDHTVHEVVDLNLDLQDLQDHPVNHDHK
jgi:hypothetical protein